MDTEWSSLNYNSHELSMAYICYSRTSPQPCKVGITISILKNNKWRFLWLRLFSRAIQIVSGRVRIQTELAQTLKLLCFSLKAAAWTVSLGLSPASRHYRLGGDTWRGLSQLCPRACSQRSALGWIQPENPNKPCESRQFREKKGDLMLSKSNLCCLSEDPVMDGGVPVVWPTPPSGATATTPLPVHWGKGFLRLRDVAGAQAEECNCEAVWGHTTILNSSLCFSGSFSCEVVK